MAFKGQVLSIGALLEAARSESTPEVVAPDAAVRHTAAGNARQVAGESPAEAWRFGVLQTLDDYASTVRRGGVRLGAAVFTDVPPSTGSAEVDAAFAALADFLAERDGWPAPAWAHETSRVAEAWFPSVPAIFREDALRESPRAFRDRGIFITASSLARA